MCSSVYLNGKITSNNKQQIPNNIINTYSIMTTITHTVSLLNLN